jgi:site-specific DNA recombinase
MFGRFIMIQTKSRRVALYARVSSDRQTESKTIASQLAELQQRIAHDGYTLEEDGRFIDDGVSGMTLLRPALERLRDQIAFGVIDRLYVHSPDRLARNYAMQMTLIDEFAQADVELVFLNHPLGKSPEDHLLLQVQGMIAEYERTKITERIRRGKLHRARQGNISVLASAPYGYRYVTRYEGGGEARYEIVAEQAAIVQQMFSWVGQDRVSLGEVARRLKKQGISSPHGHAGWSRCTIAATLRNPAYMGQANYGKTRQMPRRPRWRLRRGQTAPSCRPYSVTRLDTQPLPIRVPAIIAEDLFASVADQLAENRRRARQGQTGPRFLLQGLVVCAHCGYAYCGQSRYDKKASRKHPPEHGHYRCAASGKQPDRPACISHAIGVAKLDDAVWRDACALLRDPTRLEREYQRRLQRQDESSPRHRDVSKRLAQAKRSIGRLIDAYAEGLLEKEEFEPKLRHAKERSQRLQAEEAELANEEDQRAELRLLIGKLEEFTTRLNEGLENADWPTRRAIIQALVTQIEVSNERIRIVYRVSTVPFVNAPKGGNVQDCLMRFISRPPHASCKNSQEVCKD